MKRIKTELKPLSEIGSGSVTITDDSVGIEVFGINGSLKAWLIGMGDALPIGNIVDGKLYKRTNTTQYNGVLITQNGRQMLVGKYNSENNISHRREEKSSPLPPDYQWKEINSGDFSTMSASVKYLLSNKSVYECYKKYKSYWIGQNKTSTAIAFPCENSSENPFAFLNKDNMVKNGYSIICIDDENKRLFLP